MPERKSIPKRSSAQFAAVCEALLERGAKVRFRASGQSMQPNILHGDAVVVTRARSSDLHLGDVALTRGADGFRVHRVSRGHRPGESVITRGDSGQENDAPPSAVLGRVVEVERRGRVISFAGAGRDFHALRTQMHRLVRACASRMRRLRTTFAPSLLILFALLWHAPSAGAQTLSITNTGSPTTPATLGPGGTITYTQVLTNTGALAVAHPFTVTESLPANTTFVSAAKTAGTDTWTCANAAGTITCTDTSGAGTYTSGLTTTFTVIVTVNAGTANGTVITDTANAKGANTAAATSPAATVTVQTPDLSVAETAAPNPVATGANITYTETVTNAGAASAGGATLTQNTPAGTLFVSATPPVGWTCGTKPAVGATGAIICTANGNFAAGSVVFTIVVSVRPETVVGSTITNSVTVSETGTDPNLANNTATASVQVQGADLSMTQSASVTAIAPGGTITYTETVSNNGPNAATAAVLYQQTPPNTTFSSITPPVGWTCGTTPAVGGTGIVLCTANAAMASNTTTGAFTFIVTVNAATAAGTTIINSADVTSQTTDPLASNNATTTDVPVRVEIAGDADLALSMTASPTPVFISSNLTYTIQIQDLGLSNSADGTMTDTIPAGTTFVSSTTTQGSCSGTSTVTCTLGAIIRGTTITIAITVTAPASPTTLTNTSKVTSSTTDPVLTNNMVTVLTVVQPLVCASPGRDGSGGTLTGIVNAYYPPASAGVLAAGAISVALGPAAAGGAQTPIAAGDLVLVIQPQDAAINFTNTGAYGDGSPGDPASGWTSLNNSGNFEFVTATSAIPVTGGTLNFQGTGAGGGLLNTYTGAAYIAGSQGQRTYQVIRVPQYTSALLSSGLTAMTWNGATGGVLSIDVASQLTLGGTVVVDGLGFRGGAGRSLGGGAGLSADYVTLATVAADATKGEGIAGTPRYIVNGTIASPAQTATDTTVEGLPNGSYSRGAPGNAGGGATDADPVANDQNSGGGGGGNGGAGGTGGFGWNSAGVVGGFGGSAFPASTSALSMGGGAGAGTTNNGSFWNPITDTGGNNCGANCTGIYSSGGAGGGIVIIHAGAVTGSGTISANGQSALTTENDGGGGGGAGGTILVFASSGGLGGLTANANGGTGGTTWPEQAPGAFPGNRHGPGAGGGGGVILASATPGSSSVSGGNPGVTTLANDAYGATPGQPGVILPGLSITQTPGTQSGSYCGGADLAVTNAGAPNPVLSGTGLITYTQSVTNNGPFDALNAVFSETIPANTTFQSLSFPGGSGWTCATPGFGGTGAISCTNPDIAKAASTTFTVGVAVDTGVAVGSVITDVVNATAGSNDPNLGNNTATVQTSVGLATTADLSITNTASPNPVIAGNNITYTVVVRNNGAAAASTVAFSETIPVNTTFVSATPSPAAGWTCSVVSGTLTCSNPTLASAASTTFTVVLKVTAGTASGTSIAVTADVSSTTTDPNLANNEAIATVLVAAAGQADLSITSSATPNPVTDGNNITYTQSVTNSGPSASGVATFTDAIPAGTTFVSFSVPAGWNCGASIPAVGGTGTISCSIASLAVNTPVSFPLVVKASLGDMPGTTISNTANINVPCSSASDPNCANNSATTSVAVASPTQADVAITKTASPEPVDQGTNLQYTLQVTNNGPATAQGVTVSDPLPAEVSYVSSSTTQGTCTFTVATTTVGCSLGTVSVGGLVLITINVNANTFSSSTSSTNTATVSATTGDPNLTNNSSSVKSTILSPTAVQLASFRAVPRQGGGVLLEWKTREEIRNLGFNIFRLDGPSRQRLNPSIIAGSALLIRGGMPQHAAKTYQWFDESGTPQSTYELEDVDLNGTRMSHGPVSVDLSAGPRAGAISHPLLLTQLNRATSQPPAAIGRRRLPTPRPVLPGPRRGERPVSLDGEAAVKISVQSEGWYQVSKTQLVAAGLDPNADARTLQLYAEGIEQPILILGRQMGPLGANDSIEFYGTGIDTPFSGTRVYWLIRGSRPGMRVNSVPALSTGQSEPQSFPFTVVLEQRTTYFATLLNGENNDNFFGAAVTSEPVDQQLAVAHADPSSSMQISVDVTLQGATDQQSHGVSVFFNGASIGEMDFANMANVTNTFSIDRSLLQDGINTVTLTALEGDNDVSVVQSIALHYPHTYEADANWLKATAPAGNTVHITGFANQQIQVFDITNPLAIEQLSGTVRQENASFGITVGLPPAFGQERTLLVFSDDQVSQPSALAFHTPAALAGQRAGSQMVIITHPDFASALGPLVRMHESRGQSVEVVTIDEVFDAFSYGERSPFAIRDFLENAESRWTRKPQYLLLVGDASLDPRNYLGLGDFDFVPTRIIETAAFKTATDDWFSDFKQNGFETIATGRLPVRTVSDAELVVSKIVNYERSFGTSGGNKQALLVADQNIGADFTTATKFAAMDLPSPLEPTEIFAEGLDSNVVQQQIVAALNSGPLLVNYSGHGSVEQWSFADFLDDSSAANLTNGDQLSVYLLMDCLNGFFQDVYSTSLAESLLLAPNGGAVAVWASSGFTDQPPQASMNQAMLQILKTSPSTPLAVAIVQAKSGITDNDVRRTWIFFGDPAMVLPLPPPSFSWRPGGHRPIRQHPEIARQP